MTTLVTGASGFVGYHVARLLASEGEPLRLLVRGTSPTGHLATLRAEIVVGDLRDPAALASAMRGVDRVFHVAATYTFSSRRSADLYTSNVDGTRNLLRACGDAGVKRIVYTSSVGALATTSGGGIVDETTPVSLADMVGHYKRSKFLAQEVARSFASDGLPVVIVNPSTPIGPFDAKPTPTGKTIVDFLKGKIPAYVDTGLNFVDVESVARGHMLAAERGKPGEIYILGDRNMHLREFLELIGTLSGRRAPRWKIPHWVACSAAAASEAIAWMTRSEPAVPLEGARLARHFMYFDPSKARRELGFLPASLEDAAARAVAWYGENGYLGQ